MFEMKRIVEIVSILHDVMKLRFIIKIIENNHYY